MFYFVYFISLPIVLLIKDFSSFELRFDNQLKLCLCIDWFDLWKYFAHILSLLIDKMSDNEEINALGASGGNSGDCATYKCNANE